MSLLECIKARDLAGLRDALQGSPDLTEVDHWNRDLVAVAIVHRQPEMARLLLAAGVPLLESVPSQYVPPHSALQSAVTEGFGELIPLLLAAGAVLTERIVQKALPNCLVGLLPYLPDDLLRSVRVDEGNLLHRVLAHAGTQPFWLEPTRHLVSALLARGLSAEYVDARGATALKLAKRFRLYELYDLLGGRAPADECRQRLVGATGLTLERWPIFRSEPDVYVVQVPSTAVCFDKWVEACEPLGFWPLLLGPPDPQALGLIAENAEHVRKAGKPVDLDLWLTRRQAKLKLSQGSWPNPAPPSSRFSCGDSVVLALVPGAPEEIPGRLGPVGVNDYPPASVHAALLRRWRESYGARVFGFDGRALELQVACPPQNRETALQLAVESLSYCYTGSDAATQQQQAALLMQPLWFFWWD